MGNGTLTSSELAGVYGGHRLRADAAVSWLRLCNYFGREIKLTDSYRPLALQKKIFLERYTPAKVGVGPFGDVRFYAGVRYVRVRGAAAAVPGTSNHGLGLALDVADGVNTGKGQVWDWLNRYAGVFGWFNPDWAKAYTAGGKVNPSYEPWHWEYNPARDTKRNEPLEGVVAGQTAKETVREWDEMASKDEIKQAMMEVLGSTDIAGAVWTRDFGGQGKPEDIAWWILKNLQNSLATLSAQNKAILSNLEKNGVDPAIIAKSVKEALADIEITLKASN